MKKIIVFFLCLMLLSAFPAASLAKEAPMATLDESVCEAYDPALLRSDTLLVELPDWLEALIFDDGVSSTRSLTPAKAYAGYYAPHADAIRPGFSPSLYEPYTVTKTKTYYDKNGAAAYALILSAVFVDTNAGATCLKTQTDFRVLSGSWRISPGQPAAANGMVTAEFSVEQLFTGIAVRRETVTVRLFSYERSGAQFLSGDLTGDGAVTTEDARMALRIALELDPLTDYALRVADLTGDGVLTTEDARHILRRALELE